jgi:sulfate transport system substrate-binding protein
LILKYRTIFFIFPLFLSFSAAVFGGSNEAALLNVSYNSTTELYKEYNEAFAKYWKTKTGQDVTIHQTHGDSAKQAQYVMEGLEADVATLSVSSDIDAISQKAGLLSHHWQSRLPHNSNPYTSTVVFLVRKGNPKDIKDWDDLIKPGISIVTPNPKTSGTARWNFLAVWGYAYKKYGTETAARDFASRFYKNVRVLNTRSRGALTFFAQLGVGDVLVTWENEAYQAVEDFPNGHFEVITPSLSVLAEPSVAWIDRNTEKHGTTELAKAYLKHLYSREGQSLIVKHHFRPTDKRALRKYSDKFPSMEMFTIEDLFGGWKKAEATYFADGGIFDQVYAGH